MSAPLSRRTALARALAALPALAGAATLAGPSLARAANPDAIFAAIERHREAFSAFSAACSLTDNVVAEAQGREVTDEDEATYDAALEVEVAAMNSLVGMAPVTVAGARAAIEYLLGHDDGCMPDNAGCFLATLLESPLLSLPGVSS